MEGDEDSGYHSSLSVGDVNDGDVVEKHNHTTFELDRSRVAISQPQLELMPEDVTTQPGNKTSTDEVKSDITSNFIKLESDEIVPVQTNIVCDIKPAWDFSSITKEDEVFVPNLETQGSYQSIFGPSLFEPTKNSEPIGYSATWSSAIPRNPEISGTTFSESTALPSFSPRVETEANDGFVPSDLVRENPGTIQERSHNAESPTDHGEEVSEGHHALHGDDSDDDEELVAFDLDAPIVAFAPPKSSFHELGRALQLSLRPPTETFNRKQFSGCGWHDADDTGDYNPNVKERRRYRKRKLPTSIENNGQRKSLIVKLPLKSAEGTAILRAYNDIRPDTQSPVIPQENGIFVPMESSGTLAKSQQDYRLNNQLKSPVSLSPSLGREGLKVAQRPKTIFCNKERCFMIETHFCHPLSLNYDAPPLEDFVDEVDKYQCHFCYDSTKALFFSMFGNDITPKFARVINNPAGGYTEITGGWAEAGRAPTRMCAACVFKRIKIAFCTEHEIRRIEVPGINGIKMKTFDINEAMQKLVEEGYDYRDGGNIPRTWYDDARPLEDMNVHWCSICPYVAFWECCTARTCADTKEEDEGCGLKLCETCARIMLAQDPPRFSIQRRGRLRGTKVLGNLEALIRRAPENIQQYPDGIRADATFLCQDGELKDIMANLKLEDEKLSPTSFQDLRSGNMQPKPESGFIFNKGQSLTQTENKTLPKWKGKQRDKYIAPDFEILEQGPEDESIFLRPAKKQKTAIQREGSAGPSTWFEMVDLTC